MTTFTSLTDLITTGTIGDRCIEDYANAQARTVITSVLTQRHTATKVVLDTIRTAHHGRNEYINDQIERCYETTYRPVPTELDGRCISRSYGIYDGKTVLAHRETQIARYSAKGLRAANEIGVAQYDAWNPMTVAAPAAVTVDDQKDQDDEDWGDDDDLFDGECGHCGAILRTDTRQDLTGSQRCDDADPAHYHHIPEGSDD